MWISKEAGQHYSQITHTYLNILTAFQDACAIQQKLAFVNTHQKCILQQYKADLISSQQNLLKMKVTNQCTKEEIVKLRQIQMEVNNYKQQLDKINVEKSEILAQLMNCNEKYDSVVDSLCEAHQLLEEQRTKANTYKQESQEQKKCVEEMEEQLKTLQEQLHQLTVSLESEKAKQQEEKKQWEKEIEKLSADVFVQTNMENITTYLTETETKEDNCTLIDLSAILDSPDEFLVSNCSEEIESSTLTENPQSIQTVQQQTLEDYYGMIL